MNLSEIVPQLHSQLSFGQDTQNDRVLSCLDHLYRADYAGLSLHPFNQALQEEDLLKISADLTFQIRWSHLLIEELNGLTPEEIEAVGPLNAPYTPEWISTYMEKIKAQKKNRTVWHRFKGTALLSPELQRIRRHCGHLLELDEPILCGVKELKHALRYIPTGVFGMGADESASKLPYPHEKDRHQMIIPTPFWMGVAPVTQLLYEAVMNERPSRYHTPQCPVDSIRWVDAIVFCNRLSRLEGLNPSYPIDKEAEANLLKAKSNETNTMPPLLDFLPIEGANGYRLPTEAEWEYGAKSNQDTVYSGGDTLGTVGWYHSNSAFQTHPVCQKNPNQFGLYDMSGNVWEWCWDSTEDSQPDPKIPSDISVNHPSVPRGVKRICKGGSWYDSPLENRLSYRQSGYVTDDDQGQGFRVVRTVCGA
jgi:formylglycine-generating enzyme